MRAFYLFLAIIVLPVGTALAAPAQVTRAQAHDYLAVKAIAETDPNRDWGWKSFAQVHGDKPMYGVSEVVDYTPFRHPNLHGPAKPREGAATAAAADAPKAEPFRFPVHLRADYDDVLSLEYPAAMAAGSWDPQAKKNVSDLTGAQFSYTRDFRAGSDTWAAKGALLLPFHNDIKAHDEARRGLEARDIDLRAYGIIPSVSFDRETNSEDSTKDVNSLVFRVGGYGTLVTRDGDTLTLRLFGTYGTDFDFRSETPGAEFEVEPAFLGLGSVHFPFGDSRGGPATRKSVKQWAVGNIGLQLRFLVHGVYGRTLDAGQKKGVPEQEFFRLGPKLQLTLDPLFGPDLRCTVNYEYQGDVVGVSRRNGLLTVQPEFVLNKPADDATSLDKPLFKLSATYQNGGVDLTKESVHSFLVGLGVTY